MFCIPNNVSTWNAESATFCDNKYTNNDTYGVSHVIHYYAISYSEDLLKKMFLANNNFSQRRALQMYAYAALGWSSINHLQIEPEISCYLLILHYCYRNLLAFLWKSSALKEQRSEIFKSLRFHNLQNNRVDFTVCKTVSCLYWKQCEIYHFVIEYPIHLISCYWICKTTSNQHKFGRQDWF